MHQVCTEAQFVNNLEPVKQMNVSIRGETAKIAAETLCLLSMFPCLSISGNTVAETKFASQEEKDVSQVKLCFHTFTTFPTCTEHVIRANVSNSDSSRETRQNTTAKPTSVLVFLTHIPKL